MNENLRTTFFPNATTEKKVIAAFVTGNLENALKSKPKVSILRLIGVY